MLPQGPPGQQRFKVVLLIQPGMMVSILGGMVRIFPNLNVRFFHPGERQAAVDWLLEV